MVCFIGTPKITSGCRSWRRHQERVDDKDQVLKFFMKSCNPLLHTNHVQHTPDFGHRLQSLLKDTVQIPV